MIQDPKVRFAYVATKVAVFLVAAALTWPLARAIGPEAWIGLAVFGFVLTILTVAVLFGGVRRRRAGAAASRAPESSGDEIQPSPDVAVEIPVEDCLDLHSFNPRDIPGVVADYLEQAVGRGFSEVRLIHGRGIGVQRDRVQSLLARHPDVSGFHDAPPERGGWGATVVYLKRRT